RVNASNVSLGWKPDGTSSGPTGSSNAGCGWIDLPKIAELLNVDLQQLTKAQRDALHFATWNLGGMSPENVLDFLSRGPNFLDSDTWMLIHGHFPYNSEMSPRRIDYVAARNLAVPSGSVGPKGKVLWCARQLKADCHAALASAVSMHADHHHAIASVAKLITEPVHRSLKFRESPDLKALRKAAKGATPGQGARTAWKQVTKALQKERREWQRVLSERAGNMEWGAYRAIKQKSSRSNWAEQLLDKETWEDDLHSHMSSIFAQRPATATRTAMHEMRDTCSHMCKERPWRPFSEAEMRITMAKWKRHKATGTDGIALEALQLLFEDARWRPRIAELINDSLYKGELPPWVAEGASVLLPKTAVPKGWSDTRPITLSSAILKWTAQLLRLRGTPALMDCCHHQWASQGKQGVELILAMRKLARVAHEWRSPFYVVKIDIAKAFDSIAQEKLGTVRQGSPDSPVLFAAAIGETLDAVLHSVRGGKPPQVGRHQALEPPPHSGAAYMDDTYVWGESPEYVQEVLKELEKRFLELGLRINAKKTQVISNIPDDTFRFVIGGVEVAPGGPDTVMTILGAPVTLAGASAPLMAEMQSRAHAAFHANRKLLCSRAPVVDPCAPDDLAVMGAHRTAGATCTARACLLQPTSAVVIYVDSSGASDSSEMPWAPLEPEPLAQPRVIEADEVMDMPVQPQGPWNELPLYFFGNLSWTTTSWTNLRKPCIPHIALCRDILNNYNQATTCAGDEAPADCTPEEHDPANQFQDEQLPEGQLQEDDGELPTQGDLDWESDTDDDEEDEEPEQTTPQSGRKAPKRAAGHGSQRVANKAKKSDVKKRWRELEWGKKPTWLSWRGAVPYIMRGEKPPAKQPLPPTPSPQREHLLSLLSAHRYSYDAQGNIIPHHPQLPAAAARVERSEKATNQARVDHAQRRAENPYLHPADIAQYNQIGYNNEARHIHHNNQWNQALGDAPVVKFSLTYLKDTEKNLPNPCLTDSTTVQLKGDGVYNYPVQIVDNRPAHTQDQAGTNVPPSGADNHNHDNYLHNFEGDVLVVQPLHLTELAESSSSSSSASHPTLPRDPTATTRTGGPPLPRMDDLDQQAAEAIQVGRIPAWRLEGSGPSMRSSVRVDDNSHDLSWVQGVTPRTLPPPMPLHPRTVLSMRGSATGSWRGTTWSPPSHSIVLHPPCQQVEPTIVIYKTLAGQADRGVLPDGLQMTIHPAGEWIATTRFELGFARTPRFWLVFIHQAPPPATGRLPLKPGDSFWLEWRGQERVWQRRPRFDNDIQALGGMATIPEDVAPRPPTPPQRRDPTLSKPRPNYQGFDPQRFVDTRPLRRRLINPEPEVDPAAASSGSTQNTQKQTQQPPPHQPQQQPPPSEEAASRGASSPMAQQQQSNRGTQPQAAGKAKAKPPPPPPASSGSETETSWPSEDPAPLEGDDTALIQPRYDQSHKMKLQETSQGDVFSLMQRQPKEVNHSPPGSTHQQSTSNNPQQPPGYPPQPPQPSTEQPPQPDSDTAWYSVAANFEGEFTVSGLLRVLQKILHEMLQQTFSLPNEYLTHLAYHSCYYLSKLQSTNDRQIQHSEQGDSPYGIGSPGPTAMVFCITNAFVEAEAALESLVQNQRDLPRRHLLKELRRTEALLKDGRAIFKSWARNPNAPGALPGTAASQNALDGVDFSFLANEEGGVANLDESLRTAWEATRRCSRYMDQLLEWIQGQFQEAGTEGSPSPKKRRVEQPSSSDCKPRYEQGPRRVPERAPGPLQHDPAVPQRDRHNVEPGAAPYNVLRAQQLLEAVMPFTEQEVATSLQEVHSLLLQWTTGLWGEPIVLSDSLETNAGAGAAASDDQGAPPLCAVGTLPPTLPADNSSDETVTVESHRRRRLHAHLQD
ncbi:YCF1, partial [Symbiodinium necroappetens]